ncbi:MAG: 50S ribosomal protein L29 [Spiroplasmataceae bacterium]|jgi:ribosomal protein L29|nr:50S ribosomal protein L29 [Spiroplasmataceae bacterium]
MDKQENKPEIKKELTKEELLIGCRSTLSILKMRSKMGQLDKTHQIKQLKKEIARLLTAANKNK